MSPRTRQELLDEIKSEQRRLADLERLLRDSAATLERLRAELITQPENPSPQAAPPPPVPTETGPQGPTTSQDKVTLFRTLFRGRTDVFPVRWESQKSDRAGYSPACANDFVPGLCAKKNRGVRRRIGSICGDCENQAFRPVTDGEVLKHLQGRHVMGVYPMLRDETCWFVAADFDEQAWQDDVAAFAETCCAFDVPVAVERSRSGNGAHAWILFGAPISAVIARKLACFMITETMARRHELAMASYDRLFPNQDTMPKGGFGNLIALPLQLTSREQGNTEFLDESLRPYPDQWAFLASLRRMDPEDALRLTTDATTENRIIGVRGGESPEEEEEPVPWLHPPSNQRRRIAVDGPLPSTVRAVIAQRLFVEKRDLPSALLDRMMRLAAFQNPEFYKKQRLRLSTALVPRIIACGETLSSYISLPRGCQPDLHALLEELGVQLLVEDQRETGTPIDYEFQGRLTPVQQQAVAALLPHDIGVFVAPPGVGKTVVGTYLVAARARNTLILVHRQALLDQWVNQLALFLGIAPKVVGQVGSGKQKPNGALDVAMLQSLVRKGDVKDLVAGYGHVIVDECHHVPAVSFEQVLSAVKSRYVTGLTATPRRRLGHHPIAEMQLGPVRILLDSRSQAASRPFVHRLIVRDTGTNLALIPDQAVIQEIYGLLAASERRNDLIFNDVVAALEEGRSPILLTERRDHLDYFATRLAPFAKHLVVLHGGMRSRARRAAIEQLATVPAGEEHLVLATGRYIGEGFDHARLDTLFLALPISWKGTLVQYAGRLHRLHPEKSEVRIYDYVDREVPMLARMFERRLKGYHAIGYSWTTPTTVSQMSLDTNRPGQKPRRGKPKTRAGSE
jgi:superfamily II DNA or RNA helicase